MIDKQNLQKFIAMQLPKDFMLDLMKGIKKIYIVSYDHIFDKFEKEQAMDELPNYRRTEIENYFRLLSNRYPYIKVICKLNSSLGQHHVELYINDIILTQSFCHSPKERIRDAKFRNTLAEFNIQEEFDFGEKESTKADDKYYAILRHGGEGRELKNPQFFDLIFPSKDKRNIADPIDLLKLYGNLEENLMNGIEDIKSKESLVNPTLKKAGKTGEYGE